MQHITQLQTKAFKEENSTTPADSPSSSCPQSPERHKEQDENQPPINTTASKQPITTQKQTELEKSPNSTPEEVMDLVNASAHLAINDSLDSLCPALNLNTALIKNQISKLFEIGALHFIGDEGLNVSRRTNFLNFIFLFKILIILPYRNNGHSLQPWGPSGFLAPKDKSKPLAMAPSHMALHPLSINIPLLLH